ncbi:ABC transporter ATP-binding protein [Thalassotalea hakodatensis]|uniref:ABC transporter ATP-binding protein n=1 Tax=Thalassotalea hakodatensis TaxID=3030492 RepID=UPI002573C03B|nr:ABC transporter ATP-binding protein [Thalassotalea hakodatensis]
MLTITNLCKTYAEKKKQKAPALDDVNLSIDSGMFGLLGPNGAGKSSLMRTIATLQKPDTGTIEFAGENIIKHPEFMRKQLGYLPQDYGVYPGVSAFELLDYLAKLKGITDRKQRNAQIDKLLAQVNLTQHRNNAVSRFSGGMKQRFGIAQALLGEPKMLIVDEPTAGLDPEERNRFHNLLVEISRDKVVLLSTHIVEDVSHLCPNMAILAAGKIVKEGSPAQLIKQVQGKIWQIKTSKSNLEDVVPQANVISQRLFAGEATVHVYSESQPSPDFHRVTPDLEDAYFAALHCHAFESQLNK